MLQACALRSWSTRSRTRRLVAGLWAIGLAALAATAAHAEPDPASYWDIDEIRPGMKGTGQTVMVGTKLEEFEAEVLGVLRDVSPGRDMVLCRLKGARLEHSGIIQGMSGSPITIDGKLLGAVAYAWEFAKDPIAGVTPFGQMVQYARSNERRFAAEADGNAFTWLPEAGPRIDGGLESGPIATSGGGLAGMKPISTPLAATGFSPRALALLSDRLGPLGMTAMAGGAAPEAIIRAEGDRPLVPGAPLSIAMVTGDFDLSGIGTVTHVEGDRIYGFGHPMLSLGSCAFPMMTGYIHTVYPRASVSMKMGSPLKVVGVVDTDVSTGVAGRVGGRPDMLPMSVRVKVGRYSEPSTYRVEVVREPHMLATLVMAVLTNAIDTEGNLPEELTARVSATLRLEGHDPIVADDTYSGPRYAGPSGPTALFGTVSSIVNLLTRNPMAPVRIEGIDCEVEVSAGRRVAEIESVRLATDRVEPGQPLRAAVTLKPFKGERVVLDAELPIPADLPPGKYELSAVDMSGSINRRFRNAPHLRDPRDLAGILDAIRMQTETKRKAIYLHVPLPGRGLAVRGQALPSLPGSVRAVFDNSRQTDDPAVRSDLLRTVEADWVVEGSQSIGFEVVKDAGLSLLDR